MVRFKWKLKTAGQGRAGTAKSQHMDVPRRFDYGPQWRAILIFLLIGLVLLLTGCVWRRLFWLAVMFSFFPLSIAVMAVRRRLFVPRFLELQTDEMVIPSGRQSFRISYAEIEQFQERVFGRAGQMIKPMKVFQMRTKEHTFEINSRLLADSASYAAIKDFISSRVTPKEKPKVAERGKYGFQCAYEGNGKIYNSMGEALWQVKTLHFRKPHYPYGIFRLPDFVVYDLAEREVYRIKRKPAFGRTVFEMHENGSVVCVIQRGSFLQTKYTFQFSSGTQWTFRLPLFSVLFSGVSESGEKIRARLWSHNVWYVFIDAAADNPQLVAVLAFIHRERLRRN